MAMVWWPLHRPRVGPRPRSLRADTWLPARPASPSDWGGMAPPAGHSMSRPLKGQTHPWDLGWFSDGVAFRRQRLLCSLVCTPCTRAPPPTRARTGWSSGSGCLGASAHLAPSQTNQCGQYRLGVGQHRPLSGLSACLDTPALGTASDKLGVGVQNAGDPQCPRGWLECTVSGCGPGGLQDTEPLQVLPWTCPQQPHREHPPPSPPPQFSLSPSLRPAAILQNGGARGCAPGSRSGSMRSSGSTWRTSGSSPRRAPWRPRSPLVPGGGALAEVGAVGYSWTTQGPTGPSSRPCRREGPPWGGRTAVFPTPVAILGLCGRPHVVTVGPGDHTSARRPGPAETGVGGAGAGDGACPTP